jgi:ketosteroid isomerase-like protein
MRTILALALLTTPTFALSAQPPNTEVAEVREAIAAMSGAAADLDAEKFMQWYWKSPSLAITFDEQTLRGWDQILTEQRKWWSNKNAGLQFEDERPPELVRQAPGIVTSIQWMTVKSKEHDGNPAKLVITSMWRKQPDGWRIVLAHETLAR